MISGGKGGANTQTGLVFEGKLELASILKSIKGYSVIGNKIFFRGTEVAILLKKAELYRFLKRMGVDWKKIMSARLLPDEAILVHTNRTLFIIEKKFQAGSGSVDEKLQTCAFKKTQYTKLGALVGLNVEYFYVLCDWFKAPRYKDVLDYVRTVGCDYFFEEIPLKRLGLPES